jgi:hypothetical protein
VPRLTNDVVPLNTRAEVAPEPPNVTDVKAPEFEKADKSNQVFPEPAYDLRLAASIFNAKVSGLDMTGL